MKRNLNLLSEGDYNSFCVLWVITEYGECGFNLDIDYEMPSDRKVFELFTDENTIDDFFEFFGIDYINDIFYEDAEVNISELPLENVLKLRYAYGSVLYDTAALEYRERLAAELDTSVGSERVEAHLIRNYKNDIMVGAAIEYDIKNEIVTESVINDDDASGTLV